MAKVWCWLFGHKWNMVSSENLLKIPVLNFIFYCSRCGKPGGTFQRQISEAPEAPVSTKPVKGKK